MAKKFWRVASEKYYHEPKRKNNKQNQKQKPISIKNAVWAPDLKKVLEKKAV